MRTHVVVDMIYAFIDGSLACEHAKEAAEYVADYIRAHPGDRVLYVCDRHPTNHCSFKENGGIWPAHAIRGTREAHLYNRFLELGTSGAPSYETIFYKGGESQKEEYSGYLAVSDSGKLLKDCLTDEVIVSGIATEYCVKETVLDILRSGHRVHILANGLGYVDETEHWWTLEALAEEGVLEI